MAFWRCCWCHWHQEIDFLANIFLYFYRWHRWHQKNFSHPICFRKGSIMLLLTPLTSENWYVSQYFFCIFTIDTIDIKKVIQIPIIFFLLCHWHRWHLKKHEYVKEKHQEPCQLAFWCCHWHYWHLKIDTSANLFSIYTVDTFDIVKIFHIQFFLEMALWCCRWRHWHKKIEMSDNILSVFLLLTLLTSKKLFTSKFFSLLCCWHLWYLKKQEFV